MHQARVAAIIVCVALSWATPTAAQDPISFWNEQAVLAAPIARGATPATFIDFATVHLAMHDAVQAYDKRFEPYAGAIRGAKGSSVVAAAKAAHDVLVDRYFGQETTFAAAYKLFLGTLSPAPSAADILAGEAIGRLAATNVITARDRDGSFPASFRQFTGGTGPGQWFPNSGTAGMTSPWGANVRPFALDSLERCRVAPPPSLTSFEYTLNYIEVKLLGSATSPYRSPTQGAIARMYSGNFNGQYNRLLREIAAAHLGGTDLASLGKRARLFALTNLAMSDAFICAWSTKQEFNFWRPSHAIRAGDSDRNILTIADPGWTTYFSRNFSAAQDPNYPDYTSGANTVTGALTRMLQLIFGGDQPFSFGIWATNPAVPLEPRDPNPRIYKRFSDLANDVVDARIWLGIHFRFADVNGRGAGRRVATYAYEHVLEPVHKHGHHGWDDERDER